MSCTHEEFMKIAAKHEMIVGNDNGLNRHISFSRSGASDYSFQLTTWENHLCISGDMGTYVFWRKRDMFNFFREPKVHQINPDYWSEKLDAVGVNDDCREFCIDSFKAALLEYFDDCEFDCLENKEKMREEIKNEILICEDEHEAIAYVRNFDSQYDEYFDFYDFFESWRSWKPFTWRYIFCLRATVWGISQYDAYKAQQQAA
ncbi:hypothetical protein [Piscirickettsia litoralis]|uniref:Uncharacterized protein n=1 Tax=Piscirickettsia litoralis TaxID=1891921 RepID=A0ABX3A0H3_9GAMM|nr:hypothetical protein [Piscirickettsia litoralis]ODN41123.1 hypothetical protein BGC07_17770 [Piscirickettsia litoralis]